jgi:hypothetical protein
MTIKQRRPTPTSFVQLPLIASVAIYVRQTPSEKTEQLEQLQAVATSLGFSSDQITVYQDSGEQAAAPLLERAGNTALVQAIRERGVNVLLLHTEGCIFADATELHINTFIHLCIDNGVFIVTPQLIYDLQDLSHISQFRHQYANGLIERACT